MRKPTRLRPPHLLAAALIVLLVPLFVGIPIELRKNVLIDSLGDRYHTVLFLTLTLLLHRWGPLAGKLWRVVAVLLVLGLATEGLQILADRSFALFDWYQDALGVALGACIILARRPRLRWPAVAAAVILVALVVWPLRQLPRLAHEVELQRRAFPMLADFERPGSLILWREHKGGLLSLVTVSTGSQVLQVDHDGEGEDPGALSRRLPYDWQGYDRLRFECRLVPPAPAELRLGVWIEDRAGRYARDYTIKLFTVDHAWQTIELDLTALATHRDPRPLARQEILGLAIYLRRPDGPAAFQIDNVRLVGEG